MSEQSRPNFDLLRHALATVLAVPDKQFDLDAIMSLRELGDTERIDWKSYAQFGQTCGTVGCAMGWMAAHPDFQKLGLTATYDTARSGQLYLHGDRMDYDDAARILFNLASSREGDDLFAPALESKYDEDADAFDDDGVLLMSHKELLQHRMRLFFAKYGETL